ncbi:hypothetical protein MIMGU_mgv1a015934mg [Erythranthe guttata]|uniref:Cystatin domain-containing protein n=1 Tax=Erythranthe guttata TaxID=4155 RepID=A0A022QCM3_ERYGU|nr:PREDICTED: uncharacterized protein LOC105971694 isoform X1 [Erythranthe guttata]EYU24983.1 hypothetical protein MIMGU_mgv1a015934mg [Erythranthe guttata]|eukprot:XP_012852015.1 PREDICTED: uncharacterized protein LOC105971694 isoform X1 [Erythranthe guttata]
MACCESGDGIKVSKPQDNQENLETVKKFAEVDVGCVWYDGDPTRCDGKTMDLLKECVDLAIYVYNNTHYVKYDFLKLVHATGHLSGGFAVTIRFTAVARPVYDEDDTLKTFRARVSITHNYVEFVDFVDEPTAIGDPCSQ